MHFYLVIVAAKVKVVSGVEKHVFAEEKFQSYFSAVKKK